jgi:hypothetical protein
LTRAVAIFFIDYLSRKPDINPVENSYWEKKRTSHKETPEGMTETVKDMRKPCGNTRPY